MSLLTVLYSPASVESLTLVKWNSADKNVVVSLYSGDYVAGYNTTGSWGSVRGTQSFSTGVHEFFVRLETFTDILIGIGTASANINSYPGSDGSGYSWRPFDATKFHNAASAAAGSPAIQGDIVGIIWDAGSGTLKASLNNGTPFTLYTGIVAAEYFPMIGLYNAGDLIRIDGSGATVGGVREVGASKWGV